MTDIFPIRTVTIDGTSRRVQPIFSRTVDGTTFWLGLDLKRLDSPSGVFIAGLDGPGGPSAWVTEHECPRNVIDGLGGAVGEALSARKVPSIDDVERSFRRESRAAQSEHKRAWSEGRSDSRDLHVHALALTDLHRMIRVARVNRSNAALSRRTSS